MKGDVAVLYRAMRHQNVSINEVNEMELWEVAVAFGFDEDQTPKLVSRGERAPANLEDLSPEEQERINRYRERKAREAAPE